MKKVNPFIEHEGKNEDPFIFYPDYSIFPLKENEKIMPIFNIENIINVIPGKYYITDNGRVFSTRRDLTHPKEMSIYKNKGYDRVNLCDNDKNRHNFLFTD